MKKNVYHEMPSNFAMPACIQQHSETKAENGGEEVEVAVQGRGEGEAPSEEEARQV